MKYSNGNSTTLFCEQVSTVTSLFEKWNDCERTVVMYALLKRLRYPSLKFLLYSIENNLTQNFIGSQNNLTQFDINANNPVYLQNLITAYKSISSIGGIDSISLSGSGGGSSSSSSGVISGGGGSGGGGGGVSLNDNDSILYGSDIILHQDNDNKKYIKKEEILNDVLSMLPLLRPGNDDAKTIYLSLIPIAVEDTVRQIVSTELVQQVFSYLLIHPAISNEDRRSLSHWLRHLEDHIQSSFASSGHQSFYVLSSPADSGSKSTSVSSLSSASRNTWQTVAPPSQSVHRQQQNNNKMNNSTDEWNVSLLKMPDSFCTRDLQQINLTDTISNQNSLGLLYDTTSIGSSKNGSGGGNGSQTNSTNSVTSIGNNDDYHVSFSKNGTEIYDYSANICDKCHGHIGYSSVLLGNSCEHHLNISKWSLDNNKITTSAAAAAASSVSSTISSSLTVPSSLSSVLNVCSGIKTRRSNSLTTAISSSSSSTSSVITVNENCSNSSENLAQYSQKPRSYSLSIDNPRSGLTSSGSDTHLDDLKPNYLKFSTHNIGMSNIGQWLKSLRLHKYIGLFTNTTYEEMLNITEDYLQNLGVTKGASHKLALCIEKLKERYQYLNKIEKDLLTNQITINSAIEELTNIVLTPMKPVDMSTTNNVAGKFLHVLDLVCLSVAKKEILLLQDEDCVNALLWILERSIHNEAFVAHTNQLKEHKFKLSKLKMQFTPKSHHSKNVNNSNLNKPRWNGKSRKSDNSKCGSNDRINRKNSSDTLNFSSVSCGSLQQQQQQQQQTTIINNNPQQYSSHSDIDKFHHCSKMSSTQQQQPQQQQPQQQHHQIYNGSISNVGGVCGGQSQTVTSSCPQYKSSSYPNFSNSIKIATTNQSQAIQQQQQQQLQQQQTPHQLQAQSQSQYRNHRHSLSNLIMVPTTTQQQQHQQQQQQQQLQQQIIFKIPKQPIGNNGMNSVVNSANSSIMTSDCKNRRSSISKPTITTTTTAVPSNSTQSSVSSCVTSIGVTPSVTVSVVGQMPERIVGTGSSDNCEMSGNGGGGSGGGINKSSISMVSSFISSNNNNNNNNNSNSCSNSNKLSSSGVVSGGNIVSSSSSLSSTSSSISSSSSLTSSSNRDKILKSSIGDINSSLEFLCLQMTEQAIN